MTMSYFLDSGVDAFTSSLKKAISACNQMYVEHDSKDCRPDCDACSDYSTLVNTCEAMMSLVSRKQLVHPATDSASVNIFDNAHQVDLADILGDGCLLEEKAPVFDAAAPCVDPTDALEHNDIEHEKLRALIEERRRLSTAPPPSPASPLVSDSKPEWSPRSPLSWRWQTGLTGHGTYFPSATNPEFRPVVSPSTCALFGSDPHNWMSKNKQAADSECQPDGYTVEL